MNHSRLSLTAAGLATALVTLLTIGRPALSQEVRDARAVLLRMSVESRTTGYQGSKVIIDFSRDVPEITRCRVVHAMSGFERKEYLGPGTIVVARDGWRWHYYPGRSLVVKRRVSVPEEWDGLQRENLELVMRNYRVDLVEGAPLVGRRSLRLHFTPQEVGSRPSRRVWIDEEKGLPLRQEVYGADGTLYLVSHFEEINFDSPVPAGSFDVDMPRARVVQGDPGATTCQDQPSGETLWIPAKLPSGFIRKCVRKTSFHGSTRHQQLFTDGLSSLSLFQGQAEGKSSLKGGRMREVAVNGAAGKLYDFGLLRLLSWERGENQLVLVGEVSPDLLLEAAQSVRRIGER